ncbi:uncharacterized protein CMC5_042170 [Chondromyces crocatus]|uniref:Uncharacterized protein n=2 Tax=Chondromyces crocatus TaxID=52 RepID=A0A0K1EGU9_CHOCO|nr:uncharacterized protein CMC5_042170 [Chondromyces crocatus]
MSVMGTRWQGTTALLFCGMGFLSAACSALSGLDDFEIGSGAGAGSVTGTAGSGPGGQGGAGASGGNGGVVVSSGGEGGNGGHGPCQPGTTRSCYTGPTGTEGVGVCRVGVSTCTDERTWGECEGEITPSPELIFNDLDDDCGGTTLVDGDLLVRYLINEAATGLGAGQLFDSASNPMNLALDTGGAALFFTEPSPGQRGLRWPTRATNAMAWAHLTGGKIQQRLGSQKAATLEFVLDVDGTDANMTLFFIGTDALDFSADRLSVRFNELEEPRLYVNGSMVGQLPINMNTTGRSVLQIAIDTTQETASNRRRFYLDGILQEAKGTPPARDTMFDLASSVVFLLGNAGQGLRSPEATLHYAAIYTRALSSLELRNNATALLANDDAP